jgi:hypothetical protein
LQLLQEQVAELQAAATQNDTHVKELALQLEKTVSTLEQSASIAETGLRRALWLSMAALALSLIALASVVFIATR